MDPLRLPFPVIILSACQGRIAQPLGLGQR